MGKCIIAGGREFNDELLLKLWADRILAVGDTIISGGARGADRLGEEYADNDGHPLEVYPADWDRYGKRAGYLRNEEMAKQADTLLAFWDGESKGTKHMIDIALREGLNVVVVRYV